jgi:ribonucleoside-diphosphate reductase alpha chain
MSKTSYNLRIAPRNAHKFKEKIGFFSNRKNKRIRYLSGTYNSKLRVDKIEKAGRRQVWDFTNEPHYDFANGFVAHNCGEVPLPSEGVCCLGSINLVKMLSQAEDGDLIFDKAKFAFTISAAVRFLDSVHSANNPVLPFIQTSAKQARKLGLGVMGWADILALLKIPYDSKRARNLAKIISSLLKKTAYATSKFLARERGYYTGFDPEKSRNIWTDGELEPTRNSGLLSLAPTGSISILCDVNSSIEPFFALAYNKIVTEGDGKEKYRIKEVNKYVKTYLEEAGCDDIDSAILQIKKSGSASGVYSEEFENVFKTSHEISPTAHIKMQAAWQENICGSISKTINLPNTATPQDVQDAFMLGWELGLKGMTVFRDGCRDLQVMQTGVNDED